MWIAATIACGAARIASRESRREKDDGRKIVRNAGADASAPALLRRLRFGLCLARQRHRRDHSLVGGERAARARIPPRAIAPAGANTPASPTASANPAISSTSSARTITASAITGRRSTSGRAGRATERSPTRAPCARFPSPRLRGEGGLSVSEDRVRGRRSQRRTARPPHPARRALALRATAGSPPSPRTRGEGIALAEVRKAALPQN